MDDPPPSLEIADPPHVIACPAFRAAEDTAEVRMALGNPDQGEMESPVISAGAARGEFIMDNDAFRFG